MFHSNKFIILIIRFSSCITWLCHFITKSYWIKGTFKPLNVEKNWNVRVLIRLLNHLLRRRSWVEL